MNVVRKSILLLLLISPSCSSTLSDRAAGVIAFDLSRLNESGLQGPRDGLRALHYEFCIPARQECADEVTRIDTTLILLPGGGGRIRCGTDQYLCLGNTHQPEFRRVLTLLAELSYVHRIEESFFEH